MNPNQPNVVSPGTAGPYASMPAGQPVIPAPIQPAQQGKGKVEPPPQAANSTQNTLHISEVRDGLVIMNDGSFRAVIMCRAINFDLMSEQEREGVEYAYQGFLNSLYFPIQVFIRSQKVDLGPYLTKLDKIRSEQESMLVSLLMEDYIEFLAEIAQQTNIMDKRFYVVIGFPDENADVRRALKQSTGFFTGIADIFSGGKKAPVVVVDENSLNKAKTELTNRVQAVQQGLLECGIQSVPLDTRELIELYYQAYNPDTAERQKLIDPDDLTAEVIGKGDGNAPNPNLDRTIV